MVAETLNIDSIIVISNYVISTLSTGISSWIPAWCYRAQLICLHIVDRCILYQTV